MIVKVLNHATGVSNYREGECVKVFSHDSKEIRVKMIEASRLPESETLIIGSYNRKSVADEYDVRVKIRDKVYNGDNHDLLIDLTESTVYIVNSEGKTVDTIKKKN